MQVRILGCSGGIGQKVRTSSYLVDHDILLDAGTGVGDLTLEEMLQIKHIFITHSHMDHVAIIPLLVDTLFSSLKQPIIVHALKETIDALQTHFFNWTIWPDFTELPSLEASVLKFEEMKIGDVYELNGRSVEMIEVNHIVPAVAYAVKTQNSIFVYSGDTTTNDSLWDKLNTYPRLDLMVVESAFANHDIHLANVARHYCPELLAADLKKLRHKPKLGISHLKPGEETLIMDECRKAFGDDWDLHQLSSGDVFQL
ncbi:MAG: 3',5'-cyclic-nucleotide phosphodiesterase [Gammaproteobacteria bacterium]|nr:3',5'-cyclic-nucleotide phosphodiesterase [Gammaproteobacteria bacterium]